MTYGTLAVLRPYALLINRYDLPVLMSTYVVSSPSDYSLILVPVAIAAVIIVVLLWRTSAEKKTDKNRYFGALAGLVIIGAILFFTVVPSQGSITISQGDVTMSSSYFSATVTAAQVREAFLVNLNTWNVTLSKISGENLGNLNVGEFQLSSGASAEVISGSPMDLVILTMGGSYFILGPSNFQTFVADFSSQVAPVTNSTA